MTIVHDNPVMRDLLDDVVTSYGMTVQKFAEATADLRALLGSRPELIIVELRLDPHRDELSGLQTIHAARSAQQLRDVPIIVCAADRRALADAWPDFMERGDIHRLEMPFDDGILMQVIAAALGERRSGGTDVPGSNPAREDDPQSDRGRE